MSISGRRWISSCDNKHGKEQRFSVVTYNILTEGYMNETDYFYVPKDAWTQKSRHKKILKDIRDMDADVVCLQEVHPDYYNDVLVQDMRKLNYMGYIMEDSADFDCLALFYKTNVFEEENMCQIGLYKCLQQTCQNNKLKLSAEERDSLFQSDLGFQAITLQLKSTGKCVTIGNTHIDWTGFLLPGLQTLQVCLNILKLNELADKKHPIIITGDFNMTPDFVPYKFISTNGEANDSKGLFPDFDLFMIDLTKGATKDMIDQSRKLSSIDVLKREKEKQDQSLQKRDIRAMRLAKELWPRSTHLKSAYNNIKGNEPPVTHSATYKGAVNYTTLDYILYEEGHLESTGTLEGPTFEKVQEFGSLPSPIFGSDHIPIKSEFAFVISRY